MLFFFCEKGSDLIESESTKGVLLAMFIFQKAKNILVRLGVLSLNSETISSKNYSHKK